jgi:hypothetical protein
MALAIAWQLYQTEDPRLNNVSVGQVASRNYINRQKWQINGAMATLLICLAIHNGRLAHARSMEWGTFPDAILMQRFLTQLKQKVPLFEKGAHIMVDEPCTGRAYMLRALRAYYQNDVVYVSDPSTLNYYKAPAIYSIQSQIHLGGGIVVHRLK